MSESFLLRGLTTVSGWCLEATGILLVAWLLTFLHRKNAARRHLTWLTAFVMLLLIPSFSAVRATKFNVAFSLPTPVRDLSIIQETLESMPPNAPSAPQETNRATAPDKQAIAITTKPVERTNALRATRFLSNRAIAILGLLGVWLAGVAAVALQGIVACYGTGRIRRRSQPCSCTALDLSDLANRVGLSRRWELRVSTEPTALSAMTWGFLRPVVLLPHDATVWPAVRLEAVLLHELAHVRRCDSMSQLIALFVCALYWFHPAAWLCARAMRAAAEGAADDAVLLAGFKPSVYAAELLQFANQLGPHQQSYARIGVSIMKHSKIEARIKSIVNPSHRRRGVTLLEVLRAVGIGSSTLLTLSAMRPYVSLNQVRQNVPGPRRTVGRPHTPPHTVLAHQSGTRSVKERHLAKVGAIVAARESTPPSVHQEPRDSLVTLRGLTSQHVPRASQMENAGTVYKAVDGAESLARAMAEADAATALQRQRNATRASRRDKGDVQADDVYRSRQRDTALEDSRRASGDANGSGEAREANALRYPAEIIGSAHDPGSVARAISEADAEDALHRR